MVLSSLLWLHVLSMTAFCESLSQPLSRVRFAEPGMLGDSPPKWSGGKFVSWRYKTPHADSRTNLTITTRDGIVSSRYRIWFPEAAEVNIFDVAASDDGTKLSAVGNALSKAGSMVSFLATLDLASAAWDVIAVSPFEGEKVVFATDGTIWVLGYETGEQRKILKAGPHSLLRHYSSKGAPLGKYLDWPDIACGTHPFLSGAGMLSVKSTGIGVFLPSCNLWLDLTFLGLVQKKVQVNLPGTYRAKTALVWDTFSLPGGRVYAFINHPNHLAANGSTVHNGLFVLRSELGLWEPVDSDAVVTASGDLRALAGIEDGKFVFRTASQEFIWTSIAQ